MQVETAPARTVGFWGSTLFPVNGMIGSGIFALPAILFAALGNFAPWMMLLGGLLFLPLALCYAWLAGRFEHSGGTVLYAEAAFNRFIGFQAGWSNYASNTVTLAANVHVMVTFLAVLFPLLAGPTAASVTVIGTIAAITLINLVGMRTAVGTMGVMTLVKLLPLAALVIAAFLARSPDIGFAVPHFSDAESVILLTYYAFIGFEGVVISAGEFAQPKRDIPRALVSMVAAVTCLYILVIWAFVAIAPAHAGAGNALAAAAHQVMGKVGAIVIVIAASFSIGANSMLAGITIPRLSFGMAERNMLPSWFRRVHPRFRTPSNAIAFYGVTAALFSLWDGFAGLAVAGTLIRLVSYAISCAALLVLEKRDGTGNRWHTAAAVFAIASTIWISTHARAAAWEMLGILLLVGTALYSIAAREAKSRPA